MQEITNTFSEFNEYDGKSNVFSIDRQLHYGNRPAKDSPCNRISSLSEVFLEWFLFDSSTEKDIEKFLRDENLIDIFDEKQFIDLICDRAYLDDELLHFVALKLPWRASLGKLILLNNDISSHANLIKPKCNLIEKIQEVKTHKKEHIKTNRKKRYQQNKEHIMARAREYYYENHEYYKQYSREYHQLNKEHRKKYYKEYYQQNKECFKQRGKKYYQQNKEHALKNAIEYYQKNKEKKVEYSKQYFKEKKNKAEIAKTLCAAYVFLLKLRENDKEQYIKLYNPGQNPLSGMTKTCAALQNKNIKMCPLCNKKCGTTIEQSCNPKVLSLPSALKQIKTIAKDLKQR